MSNERRIERLPEGLVVGTMCHCDDPDECYDHWEFFTDAEGFDEDDGHLRSGRHLSEGEMRAIAALVAHQFENAAGGAQAHD